MPASVAASGEQTAVVNTVHTLATVIAPAGGATYVLTVDISALAGAETVTLTVRSKARTTDATRQFASATYDAASADKLVSSDPRVCVAGNTFEVTLQQIGGTGRLFPWSVERLDG